MGQLGGRVPERVPEIPLRELKKERTRGALQAAAFRLFQDKGYTETSVDDIARAAEVSRSTFFRYFGSKEAVLFAQMHEGGENFLAALKARPEGESPLRAFEEALVDFARKTSSESDTEREIARRSLLTSTPPLQAEMGRVREMWASRISVTLANRDGLDEPGPIHRIATAVGMAVSDQLGEEWQVAGGQLDVVALIRDRFAQLRRMALDRPLGAD